VNTYSYVQQKGEDEEKKKRRENGSKRRKGKNVNEPVSLAPARVSATPGYYPRRGVGTPGVVSSAACALIVARYSSSSRACTCSASCRTSSQTAVSLPSHLVFSFSLSTFITRRGRTAVKDFREGSRSVRRIEPRAYGLGISRSIAGLIDAVDERVVRVMGETFPGRNRLDNGSRVVLLDGERRSASSSMSLT